MCDENQVTADEVTCGDGIVSSGTEECECEDKSTSCRHCTNCQIAQGKECTPDDADLPAQICCGDDGMFKAYGTACTGYAGYTAMCAAGACIDTGCPNLLAWTSQPSTGNMCEVNPVNNCKIKCESADGNSCSSFENYKYGSRSVAWLPDGTPCTDKSDNWSVCGEKDGDFTCLDGPAVCGNGNVDESTAEECECDDRTTSCSFCTDCKLTGDADCSPDQFGSSSACCGSDGKYSSYKTACTDDASTGFPPSTGRPGFCARGECILPCDFPTPNWDQYLISFATSGGATCPIDVSGCSTECVVGLWSDTCRDVSNLKWNSEPVVKLLSEGTTCKDTNDNWSICDSNGGCIVAEIPITCSVNQHVVGGACVDCEEGFENVAGDVISQGDSECTPVCSTIGLEVPCVFPFTYNGVEYTTCTGDHHNNVGLAYCGEGSCSSDCATDSSVITNAEEVLQNTTLCPTGGGWHMGTVDPWQSDAVKCQEGVDGSSMSIVECFEVAAYYTDVVGLPVTAWAPYDGLQGLHDQTKTDYCYLCFGDFVATDAVAAKSDMFCKLDPPSSGSAATFGEIIAFDNDGSLAAICPHGWKIFHYYDNALPTKLTTRYTPAGCKEQGTAAGKGWALTLSALLAPSPSRWDDRIDWCYLYDGDGDDVVDQRDTFTSENLYQGMFYCMPPPPTTCSVGSVCVPQARRGYRPRS